MYHSQQPNEAGWMMIKLIPKVLHIIPVWSILIFRMCLIDALQLGQPRCTLHCRGPPLLCPATTL